MFVVRFIRKGKQPNEEYYYHFLKDAVSHYSLFENDDSALYSQIIIAYQIDKAETIIMQKYFRMG